ncbi:TetR/AcrR family transcriptional regulator [Sphingomonas sp. LaA6.9]|uniref:TetR/AcrR family transcriptional regulator n=1 Tax=Sphingomonas sp. LaA6.9 TaxID=2919914 RepID=UPI001F4F8EF6|nr:TetR/AcrR family transcriptional regulator [Sphingomonas sp. LaA6.9]MCJ8159144.1 TetR/AcrR family transcriptional regulator [Sphingomonas sp. LaA6.9]
MARTRSDEKRREIIRVSAETFQELGYERTSMLTIAERMRGSKQTLYNYFPSKEDLLRAVLDFDVGEIADQAMEEFLGERSLRKGLIRLGEIYLARQLDPLAISNMRIVATQPAESGIGEDFYENILCVAWKRVADAFKALMGEGKLRRADPWIATMHFKGLMLQDLLERQLLNAAKHVDPKEVEAAVKHAVDAFLRIYGNEEPKPGKARG